MPHEWFAFAFESYGNPDTSSDADSGRGFAW